MAWRLNMTVEAVKLMSEWEYLGWQAFLPVKDMWDRLATRTAVGRR